MNYLPQRLDTKYKNAQMTMTITKACISNSTFLGWGWLIGYLSEWTVIAVFSVNAD